LVPVKGVFPKEQALEGLEGNQSTCSTGPGTSESVSYSGTPKSATRTRTPESLTGHIKGRECHPGKASSSPTTGKCTETQEGGGFPKSASSERTGESRGKGLTSDGNAKDGEQNWKLAIRWRFRVNGYVCCTRQPFQNLSRDLFPPRRFSPPDDSAASMAQRDNRHTDRVLGMHPRAGGATRRCPVQPSTPLGPDQVNVLLFFFSIGGTVGSCQHCFS
jgi:hypothetical protein